MDDIFKLGKVLLQVFDFLFKAAAAFRQTPEGAKEWSDIYQAWAETEEALANPGTVVVDKSESGNPVATTEAGQPLPVFRKGIKVQG